MASAPANALPLFYNDLQPLSSQLHAGWKARTLEAAPFFGTAHAVPLTVEEFILAQRHYPIVFSAGENPVPLGLFGLNEGVNVFTDESGIPSNNLYIPAYVRRYPFMLAKLRQDSDDLSLCFDSTSGVLGEFEDGMPLFEGTEPTESIKNTLAFCEQFEQAGMRTGMFMQELIQNKLLIDGEVTIEPEGADQPFVYRGFQIISEEKLKELRGDVLRKMVQTGLLPLIHAHLFSLSLIRDVFAMQLQQGKAPSMTPPVAA
ncbi:SapC family protein [Sphingomonas sp. SRS2]|uniref:SapC family protein n=1 Tax=Sphingomonas sp. SRS2 TaxID=133190 RepID=UPI0006184A25|nr:SapC family protein [Sphingomonas sp. SRS2]KKC26386.1 multidrug transporter [Sphingomonas sp. SRS2]